MSSRKPDGDLPAGVRLLAHFWRLPDPVGSGGTWRRVVAWSVGAAVVGLVVFFVASRGISGIAGVSPWLLTVAGIGAWSILFAGLVRKSGTGGG